MKHAALLCAWAVVTMSSPALADIIPPDESACTSKSAGDSCDVVCGPGTLCPTQDSGLCGLGASCACQDSMCGQLFYVCVDSGIPDAALDADAGSGVTCQFEAGLGACLVCSPVDGGEADATVTPRHDAGFEGGIDDVAPDVDDDVHEPNEAPGLEAGVDAAAARDGSTGPTQDSGSEGSSGSRSGCSCSVPPTRAVRVVSPWLLAGLVPLLLRRKRQR
jgi:MYXO-CTERM domain-containing protein